MNSADDVLTNELLSDEEIVQDLLEDEDEDEEFDVTA
jgi:hypothetical protein